MVRASSQHRSILFGAIRGPRPSADGPGHTRMAWDPSKAWPKLTNQKTLYAIKYLNIYCTKKCDIRKDEELCANSAPALQFAIWWNPIKALRKTLFFRTVFARFSHVFRSTLMGFHHIANWRVGAESAHNSSSFSYIALFGTINIQILNCVDSFLTC